MLKSMIGRTTGIEWRFAIPLDTIDPERAPPPTENLANE